MEDVGAVWLAGLRRFHAETSALDRWIDDRGLTGAIWTPDGWVPGDAAGVIVRLTGAGAGPDASLLWDLVVTDARAAADALRHVYRSSDGADGYVAVWLDPSALADTGKAAAAARDLCADVRRENVAVAFAWTPARAGAVSAIVAAGIPVALAGAADVDGVVRAHGKGMDRRRKDADDDEDVADVPVFLLDRDSAGGLRGVRLAAETGLLAPGRGTPPRVPADPEAEREAFSRAIAGIADRARGPERDDSIEPPAWEAGARHRCDQLEAHDVPERIWARDHTVWRDEEAEIADRLGWLDIAETMRERTDELEAFAHTVRSGGVNRIVLLGMGGSSLAAETFRAVAGGGVALTVLDSTDPDHVADVSSSLDGERTVFVVASKSGTTVETLSHLEHFWDLSKRGDRFVAVTDPGTSLAALGADRGFRRVFENPPDIGGRFSALSYFGLVPATLCGIDIRTLLDRGLRMQRANAACVPPHESPGARLGGLIADAALEGRDKLTLVLPPRFAAFGAWVEQLVAESTGKEGLGVVPVDGEEPGALESYGDDRVFVAYALGDDPFPPSLESIEAEHPVVRIRVPDAMDVGAEMYRWELATAVLGRLLGVQPFDQPDVESSKRRTREALDGAATGSIERGSAAELLEGLAPPQYVAVQAFITPSEDNARRLAAVRTRLRDRYRVATTVGFGPRFLHSTGQLHKGGPEGGVFLQVTGPHVADVAIPGRPYTFGALIDAQADGDLRALRDAGRGAARLELGELEALA